MMLGHPVTRNLTLPANAMPVSGSVSHLVEVAEDLKAMRACGRLTMCQVVLDTVV